MPHRLHVLHGAPRPDELERVRPLLGTKDPDFVFDCVSSAVEFVRLARAHQHGLLLLTHAQPDFDATAILRMLVLDRIDTPVVIVADPVDAGIVGPPALRLGIYDLVLRGADEAEHLMRVMVEVATRRRAKPHSRAPLRNPQRALFVRSAPTEGRHIVDQLAGVVPTLEVENVTGAGPALERLSDACNFDLLLTVHHPPDLDAEALVRGMRERGFDLPVILLGELDDEPSLRCAFTVDAVDYVTPRIPAVELALRIEHAIDRRELRRANERTRAEIAERQRMLAALRESDKRLNLAIEAGRIGLWSWDVGTGHAQFSRHWKAQLGYADHEIRDDSSEWETRCHPDDLAKLKLMTARYLAAPWPEYSVEYRMRHKDGTWRTFLLHADLEFDDKGRPMRMVGSQVEVTTLKQQQSELASASARLQQLSRRLLDLQETERRHLARELHDEIGQVLTVAKIHLQSAAREPGASGLAARMQEPISLLDRLLAQVRSLSLNLRPPLLDDLGLVPALHWLQQQREPRGDGPRIHLTTAPEIGRFDPTIETACFRIAQEALTNALRHGQASNVHITLSYQDGRLRLRVQDDGVGFDAASARARAEAGASLGLLGMHERTLLVGGTLSLLSAPGRGTQVEAVFPLSNPSESH